MLLDLVKISIQYSNSIEIVVYILHVKLLMFLFKKLKIIFMIVMQVYFNFHINISNIIIALY